MDVRIQQHPQTQHVLDGAIATFTCQVTNAVSVYWRLIFPNGTAKSIRHQNDIPEKQGMIFNKTKHNSTIILSLTVIADLYYNSTKLPCIGYANGQRYRYFSDTAFLFVYSSLHKLSLLYF